MEGLFDELESTNTRRTAPLAERMRPATLEEIVGQQHLIGPSGPLRAFVEKRTLPSCILWGPPGTGKTTLARALTQATGMRMQQLSAVDSGVKELRQVITAAKHQLRGGIRTVVFIDEIHRFTKGQQDALLHGVEQGDIILIGATTENPSFEVNNALLSRCHVYRLYQLTNTDIEIIINRALERDEVLRSLNIHHLEVEALVALSGGDARTALNALETSAIIAEPDEHGTRNIGVETIKAALLQRVVRHDKAGDSHYDLISAFIKTIRGSDPDAALVYLAAMLEGGEDPLFIARRLVILASEDIGNADPQALLLAVAGFQAIERIGMPEGGITLSQITTYLASAPKSNASYVAINAASQLVRNQSPLTVPLHLRNATTSLMQREGYGRGYRYPHDAPDHVINENYFPPEIPPQQLYAPSEQGAEAHLKERLQSLWPERLSANTGKE